MINLPLLLCRNFLLINSNCLTLLLLRLLGSLILVYWVILDRLLGLGAVYLLCLLRLHRHHVVTVLVVARSCSRVRVLLVVIRIALIKIDIDHLEEWIYKANLWIS